MNARQRKTIAAAAAAALLAAAFAAWMHEAERPSVAQATAAQPPAVPPLASSEPTAASTAGVASPPAGSAPPTPPAKPLPPAADTPAESLRKVQLALGSGTPAQALEAAHILQACAHAAKNADAMFAARDSAPLMPPNIKKFMDSFGGITNDKIEQAQREQRRCQVFDAATLAQRGELFRRAHEGGAPGSALSYLTWLNSDAPKDKVDAALVTRLQKDVLAAADAGDIGTLAAFAFSLTPDTFGATLVQQQAYRQAFLRIQEQLQPGSSAASKELIAKLGVLVPPTPLTPEQQREADLLAQQVLDAFLRHQHRG